MGDGSVKNGKKISHSYIYPGKYVVSLNAVSGEFSQGDTAVVNVFAPELSITKRENGNNGFVEITNSSNRDVNISGLILRDDTKSFAFPDGTMLSSKSSVRFLNSVTDINNPLNTILVYGNGVLITDIINAKSVSTLQSNQEVKTSISPAKKVEVPKSVSQKSAPIVQADVGRMNTSINISDENGDNVSSNIYYFMGALGLTFLVLGVFYVERVSKKRSAVDDLADEYEIIEKID